MNPILTDLGVPAEVQFFFQKNFKYEKNALHFLYGDSYELYNNQVHHIPANANCWIGGDPCFHNVRELFICSSAMEAIAFLSVNLNLYKSIEHLSFVSLGLLPCRNHFEFIRFNRKGQKLSLVMGSDVLGRVSDIKIATGIYRHSTQAILAGNCIEMIFKGESFIFSQNAITLSAFEKRTKFRSRIRTYKAVNSSSFLDGLKSGL